MPDSIPAFVTLLLFIVPGYLAVELDSLKRPSRRHTSFDRTVLSVLISTVAHLALIPIATILLDWSGD